MKLLKQQLASNSSKKSLNRDKKLWCLTIGYISFPETVFKLTSVRYKLVQIANLSFRWSVVTKAAGLDNAGSKWSREAQTKFVPRGLRQGSIINESQKHCKKRDLSHTLPLAPLGGELRFEMTNTIQTHQFIAKVLYRTQVKLYN